MMKTFFISILAAMFLLITPLSAYADSPIDFNKLFENNGTVILLIDPQTGMIEHANKAAADFYGYTIEQMESMKLQDISALPPEETVKAMQTVVNEKSSYFTTQYRLKSGDVRIAEVYSSLYITGDSNTILAFIIHDITNATHMKEKNWVIIRTFLIVLACAVVLMGLLCILLLKSLKKQKISEENIHLLLDSAAEAIYGTDMKGNCTFCNANCLKLLGYSHQDELSGENMHMLIHSKRPDGSEFPEGECRMHNAILKGEGMHIEDEVFWRADGSCFPVEYYSYPQYSDGAVIGAVVTFTDITERKIAHDEIIKANRELESANKLLQDKQHSLEEQNLVIEELNGQLEKENKRYQQQKEILQAIIDSLGGGIIMLDPSGRIIFINKAWQEMFSYLDFGQTHPYKNFYINAYTYGNMETFLQNMLTGVENSQKIAAKLLSLIGDNETRYTVVLEQNNPVKRFLNLYSNPCISHTKHCFGRILVARDISHQKEVDRLKLELISTVSHELRTPMSSILGFSELLLTRKLTEERNKEYIGIINSEARRLTDLINDFLDIQRMESGKQVFNKKYSSMAQIIGEAIKLFENIDDKHTIIYDKRMENIPQTYCDRDKIMQVLSNLLSNAIKFSPDGGEIKVVLTVEDERVKVSVIDHGLGIPDDTKDKLFTKFYRIDNDDRRKIGGSGLGLAICKEIIRAHGGEIGVESVCGEGSTFYFSLPYMETNLDSEPGRNENNDLVSEIKGNLLIVEDDLYMVKLIKEILKDEGLVLHDVRSGEEALELVARYCYKLIILDIALSGRMNGLDVLKELKSNQATVDIPIVISSIYENKGIASQNDITDYLVKPFEPEQLIRVVRKALNGKLNSKMMVNSNDGLTDVILKILKDRGINVKQIEYSANMLIITLDEEEGL